jgi:hypothetical protein
VPQDAQALIEICAHWNSVLGNKRGWSDLKADSDLKAMKDIGDQNVEGCSDYYGGGEVYRPLLGTVY